MLIDWEDDRDAAVLAIRSRRARFAILLKTKDDAFFLDAWIRHHAAIVGLQNLIVFDNNSSEQPVKDVLDSYNGLLTIRFNGFHNDLHIPECVPELYSALSDSFQYFQFLDTDEFLVLIRGHRWYDGPLVARYMDLIDGTPIIPTPWLYCVPGFSTLIKFGRQASDLYDDIKWGKPILSTGLNLKGIINHNIQVDRSLYAETIPCGLFVLHRAQLSPLNRIKSNLKKLVARQFARPGESADEVLQRDRSNIRDNNISLYLSEMTRLRGAPEPSASTPPRPAPGHFIMAADSRIEYFSDEEMMLMGAYLSSRGTIVRKALWAAPSEKIQ